jgi:hypothetical protein
MKVEPCLRVLVPEASINMVDARIGLFGVHDKSLDW